MDIHFLCLRILPLLLLMYVHPMLSRIKRGKGRAIRRIICTRRKVDGQSVPKYSTKSNVALFFSPSLLDKSGQRNVMRMVIPSKSPNWLTRVWMRTCTVAILRLKWSYKKREEKAKILMPCRRPSTYHCFLLWQPHPPLSIIIDDDKSTGPTLIKRCTFPSDIRPFLVTHSLPRSFNSNES